MCSSDLKCGRFEQDKCPGFEFIFGNKSIPAILKNNIGRPCQGVQYHKANIVAGIVVFFSYITQSGNEIFHLSERGIILIPFLLQQSFPARSGLQQQPSSGQQVAQDLLWS